MPEPAKYYDRLAGQAAIVTGAGAPDDEMSNGRAIALLFAREGARVVAVTRDPANAARTAGMITAAGGEAIACAGDVTDPADCARIVEATLAAYGTLDILINNVGRGFGAPRLEGFDDATWQEVLDINLTGTFNMCRAALPALLAGSGKAIVNISSTAGQRAHGAAGYGPAKAALDAFTRELATIYGREGLRANIVSPGHLYTPHVANNPQLQPLREARRKVAPLGIEGDAWDVAATTLFLASREARLLTGVLIPVDAGVSQIAAMTGHMFIDRAD
ncbi:SDR family oxidoreductase [Sphingobium sp.]|uniref:SDR family NAD(P)-dependent oxidoreductase n=1 Tax=Sphingobium sp. TaxID=1912891 RepID=UPI0028BE29C7|nr:SDR family oxidoreductase [Sphingobium sp.]